MNVIEYYDDGRKANISIITDDTGMVQAISFCFKDNPFPLAKIFSPEMKTFIAMPDGFRGVPFPINGMPHGFTPPPPPNPDRKGCSGCGQTQTVTEQLDAQGKVIHRTRVDVGPEGKGTGTMDMPTFGMIAEAHDNGNAEMKGG